MRFLAVFPFLLLSSSLAAKCYVIDNVNIISMVTDSVDFNRRVEVKNGLITTITDSPTLAPPLPKECIIIDGQNGYLIPGLIDAHVHQHRPEIEDSLTLFKLHVANGVLAIRNLADFPGQDAIESKRRSELLEVIAPRYLTSGMHLSEDNLKTPDDAVKLVKLHIDKGYDYIKLRGNLEKSVYLRLLDEAYKANIPVIGHAQRHLPLNYSLRMHELSHVEELVAIAMQNGITPDPKHNNKVDEIVAKIKTSGIAIVSSLSIIAMIPHYTTDIKFQSLKKRSLTRFMAFEEYEWFTNKNNPSYQSAHFRTAFMQKYISDSHILSRQFTKKLVEAGVPVVAGSDNLGFHIAGFSLHDELEEMVLAGLTPFEALKAATVTSARHLGLQPIQGTIEEGKRAEMVLLEKNPLERISHARNPSGVMTKGRWLGKRELNALLCSAAKDREAAWPAEVLQKISPLTFCEKR
ncbi:amidohydrolase family protein [Rheinheimera fenheensis]|uniref:amidohydrolase family protein n=1 Tax=Rheinheimera fenheensis TaxID=3152295 RepID=UPI00325C4D23